MKVELIPLIEIGYHNQGIPEPTKHPYWKYPNEWQTYCDKCYEKAGFSDKFIPYSKGLSFYRAKDISDNNLLKIINDHLEDVSNPDDSCALFGGYVLKINGENKLFPQCCSELSDIFYWQSLVNPVAVPFNGHPCPEIVFKGNDIVLKCDDREEDFCPETDKEIIVSSDALKIAVSVAISELGELENNIKRIESKLNHQPKIPWKEILIYNKYY